MEVLEKQDADDTDEIPANSFQDDTVGQNISKSYVPAIQKGFEEACITGRCRVLPVSFAKIASL
jgi:hypothetical protein